MPNVIPASGDISSRDISVGQDAVAVTTSDTVTQIYRGLYIGTGGDVTIMPLAGSTGVLFKTFPDGMFLPVACKKVMATGTTATNIVGIK